MTEPKQEYQLIDFNNYGFQELLAKNLKVDKGNLKHYLLPQEGHVFSLGSLLYKVQVTGHKPYRFTAIPVGFVRDVDLEKSLLTPQSDPVLPTNPSKTDGSV